MFLLAWLLLLAAPSWTLGGIVQLIAANGIAHGCPIGPTTILTARHVAAPAPSFRQNYFVWSANTTTGSAWTTDVDWRRDLGVLTSDAPLPYIYGIAADAPVIGEKVAFVGYDDRLQPRIFHTEIVNIVAAHLVLDSPGAMGASGSCVLNTHNAAVGVFQWSISLTGKETHGVASGIWGPWQDVSWVPPELKEAQ